MKKLLLFVVCLLFALPAAAQKTQLPEEENPAKVIYDGYVTDLSVAPVFKKGGFNKYCDWVHTRVRYPNELKLESIEGSVRVKIIIETDGSVTLVEVLESPHDLMTEAVTRVIQSSPKWSPGHIFDKTTGKDLPVRISYIIPVEFKVGNTLSPNDPKGQWQRMDTRVRTYGSH